MIMSKNIIISNVYYMLSYAYQNLQQDIYNQIASESFDSVVDLFAAILAKAVATQLKRGLSKGYIERNEVIAELKGKINISESIQLKLRSDHRLSCMYDELSENHYMNRILKTTSEVLILAPDVKRVNKDELKKSLLLMSAIDTLNLSAINWQRFQYHRNNSAYQMLMGICYLVLNDLLLTTTPGEHKLMSFFDDQKMHKLFERFTLAYYCRHYTGLDAESKRINWNTTGNTNHLPSMQSDIMLQEKWVNNKNQKKLIIDTKFYGKIMQSQHDFESLRSGHLYQIYAYVKNEDTTQSKLVDGMLLYAKTAEGTIPNEQYVLDGSRISVRSLDLNLPFRNISEQLDLFVTDWMGEKNVVKV